MSIVRAVPTQTIGASIRTPQSCLACRMALVMLRPPISRKHGCRNIASIGCAHASLLSMLACIAVCSHVPYVLVVANIIGMFCSQGRALYSVIEPVGLVMFSGVSMCIRIGRLIVISSAMCVGVVAMLVRMLTVMEAAPPIRQIVVLAVLAPGLSWPTPWLDLLFSYLCSMGLSDFRLLSCAVRLSILMLRLCVFAPICPC